MRADPPYRILTERLAVRCWEPSDAAALKEAKDSSLDHLRAWMPWAWDDPKPLADNVALLRRFRGLFDLGQDFVYGIFDRDETRVLGGTGLHTRVGEDAFEIGYWIRADAEGRGFVTEAVAAETRVAFELCGADRVEIRIDPENARSLAVPARLAYREEARLRRRLDPPPGEAARRDLVLYALFADEYQSTPSAAARVEAFDAAGARVL